MHRLHINIIIPLQLLVVILMFLIPFRRYRAFAKAVKVQADPEVIENHTTFLNEQLNCLKLVKKNLQLKPAPLFMSTPIVHASNKRDLITTTPLLLDEESPSPLLSPSGFSMWQNENVVNRETSYSMKLQRDLDVIMYKLNGLLDQSNDFEISEESLTKL